MLMINFEKKINSSINKLLYFPIVYYLTLGIIILFALAVRINVAYKHCIPKGDEGAWLRLAVQVPNSEFMTSKVIEHDFYHERKLPHPEDNRSPLYPILIALFRVFNKDAFRAGQILNLLVCTLFIILFAFAMHNTFGCLATIASLVFFAASPFLIVYSTQIYPDLLIALGFIAFLYKADNIAGSMRNSLIGGFGLGLMFLLKTTALFLIPMFVIIYLRRGYNKDNIKKALLFTIPAFLVSLPWLIRNQLIFSTPLFQVAKYTLYMESFHNFFDVGLTIPTLAGHLKKYGFFHVFLFRPVAGFIDMLKLFPHFDHNLSLALLPLSIAGVFNLRGKSKLYKPVFWFSIFFIPFMAYIAYNSWVARYILVYYVLLYGLAGSGVGLICGKIKQLFLRFILMTAAITLPLITVLYPIEFYLSKRGNEHSEDILNREIVAATEATVPDSSVVLSPFLSQYFFMHDLFVVNALNFKTVLKLEKFIRIYGIDYVLLKKDKNGRLWKLLNDPERQFTLHNILTRDSLVLYKIEMSL